MDYYSVQESSFHPLTEVTLMHCRISGNMALIDFPIKYANQVRAQCKRFKSDKEAENFVKSLIKMNENENN